MIRVVRVAAAVLAALCAVWTIKLIAFGGIRFVVAGHLIRSYDYWRSLEIGAVALLVRFAAGGWRSTVRIWIRFTEEWGQPTPQMARALALVLVVAVFVISFIYQSTTAGGADSSGYMSEAVRWLRGTTISDEPWAAVVPWPNAPWTFTPLGYTYKVAGASIWMTPVYPPGFPWLLAVSILVGGYAGMAFVEPFFVAVIVYATYGIGRRLRGPWTGLTAAWLVATSPVLLFSSMSPMSDVPAAAGWAAAFFFLLGDSASSAFAAGLSAALAIVIRPNLLPLAALMSLWFVMRPGPRPFRLRDVTGFALGVAPGLLAIALVFDWWHGSPFDSGYERLGVLFDRSHVWPNFSSYTHNAVVVEPILSLVSLAGFLALPVIWPRGLQRRAMLLGTILVVAVVLEYLTYQFFGDWTFLRFFVCIWALLGVSAAGLIARAASGRSARLAAIVIALVVGAGLWNIQTARARGAFAEPEDRHYAAVGKLVSEVVPPQAVVLSMQHSGSLRYYSGRLPLRWDVLEGNWLDTAVKWLSSHRVQTYAVLESWEVPSFRGRFAGQQSLAGADVPVAVYHSYESRWTVFVYNLSTPPHKNDRPIVIDETDPSRWRNWPAGLETTLTFTGAK